MALTGSQQITQLLLAWGQGDQAALEALMPLVYDEMRKVAARHLRGQQPNHPLQTTALARNSRYNAVGNVQLSEQSFRGT